MTIGQGCFWGSFFVERGLRLRWLLSYFQYLSSDDSAALERVEFWRDAFFFFFNCLQRGFLVQLRDERKEKLDLSLELGAGEVFLLEHMSLGRGLEARERRYSQRRWADQWPLKNWLGPALPFSPQLENIPICPKLARDSSGPLSAPPPLISQLRTISSLIAGSGPADRSGHMYLIRRSWGLWNDKWGFSFQSSLCRILETAVGFGW